jgi:hypothetical protein
MRSGSNHPEEPSYEKLGHRTKNNTKHEVRDSPEL